MTGDIRVDQEILKLIKAGKKVDIIHVPMLDPDPKAASKVPINSTYISYPVAEGVWIYAFSKKKDGEWEAHGNYHRHYSLDLVRLQHRFTFVKTHATIKAQMELAR